MRPIVLGMNNPYGSDPRHALYPLPVGCSGHRLWKIIHDACGMSKVEYLLAFDRRNLLAGEWDRGRARAAGQEFRADPGSTVVVLGREVWDCALRLPRSDPGEKIIQNLISWIYLPHPSGRVLWYNDEQNRRLAGELLANLAGRY